MTDTELVPLSYMVFKMLNLISICRATNSKYLPIVTGMYLQTSSLIGFTMYIEAGE